MAANFRDGTRVLLPSPQQFAFQENPAHTRTVQLRRKKSKQVDNDLHAARLPPVTKVDHAIDNAIDALSEQHRQEGQTTVEVQVGHHGIQGNAGTDRR